MKITTVISNTFNGNPGTIFQFIRYFFVGGIAFAADFGSLYLLTDYWNLYYLAASVIAFIIGLIINYTLSITWVFNSSSAKSRLVEFTVFCIIGIIGLLLNTGFMYLFTEILLLYYLLSKILSTILVFLWNFFARKFILFTNPSHNTQ